MTKKELWALLNDVCEQYLESNSIGKYILSEAVIDVISVTSQISARYAESAIRKMVEQAIELKKEQEHGKS